TEQGSQEALLEQLARAIEAERTPGTRAVGIGMPSIIEFATGRILASVNIPLRDIPLRELLSERAGVPVYVENDAGCAALAEAFASGRGLDRLAEDIAIRYPDSFIGRRYAEKGDVNGHDVVDGAEAGDHASRYCLEVLGERLGIGIANAINTFDPLEVVIGGG